MKKSMRLKHRLKKLSAAQKKIEERKPGEKQDAQTLSVCVRGNTGDTLNNLSFRVVWATDF